MLPTQLENLFRQSIANFESKDVQEKLKFITAFFLFWILIVSFLIRYQGIRFGFPIFTHGSEPIIVNASINMVRTGDLNPHVFFWTSLFFYLQTAVYFVVWKIGQLFGHYSAFEEIELTTLYFWGRFLSIVLSVATVYVSYRIARALLGRVVGALTAIFVASAFLLIENAYLIKADTTMTFLILCSTFFAARIFSGETAIRNYVLSGVFLGLAIGTKQSAFLAVTPILVAHLKMSFRRNVRWAGKEILASGFAVLGAFIVVNPYALLDHELFLNFLAQQRKAYAVTLHGVGQNSSHSWYLMMFVKKFGFVQLALAGLGIVTLGRKNPVLALFLGSVPLAFWAFFGSHPRAYGRNVLPIIPFFSIFAGFAVAEINRVLTKIVKPRIGSTLARSGTGALLVLVVWAAYGQSSAAIADARKKNLPDTRWISKVWVEGNIPPGSAIGRDAGTTPLGLPRYWKMPHGPEVSGGHWYPELESGLFKNTYLGGQGFIRNPLIAYDYVITNLSPYSKMKRNPRRFEDKIEKYEALFSELKLIKEFRPKRNESTGPVLRIYEIGSGKPGRAAEEQLESGTNEGATTPSVTHSNE